MTTITKEIIKEEAANFDIELVFQLEIKGKNLISCGCLAECLNLEILDLSNNQLEDITAIQFLIALKYLNLSNNRISDIESIGCLEQLKTINLAGNLIKDLQSIFPLKNLQYLTTVRFVDRKNQLTNPVCSTQSYRHDICNLLKHLEQFDDEFLKSKYNNLFDTLYGHDLTNENFKTISKRTENMYKEPWFSKDLLENPTKKNQTFQITNDLNNLTKACEECENNLNDIQEYLANMGQMFHV